MLDAHFTGLSPPASPNAAMARLRHFRPRAQDGLALRIHHHSDFHAQFIQPSSISTSTPAAGAIVTNHSGFFFLTARMDPIATGTENSDPARVVALRLPALRLVLRAFLCGIFG